ncbi:DUF1523 family protein [Donghicola sp. C2-DW-16]|uniref:DUF1523 family protein n=1 Tax=Donghicola mangrovi TaxID=2729614 RepID=A0ABX2PAL1_9RHOB|nr:DUF1523 family protein [Donghicola mangrovi]NVO26084.1 DUF1523 family protein [Donghicola mangrovi]
MAYIRWTITILFWAVVAAFLHYTLPQTDIVRITDTYEKRQDFTNLNQYFWASPETEQQAASASRDVFFIQTFDTDGKPVIFRNEDTGWGWPPYFKFDTANLQARASDLISKSHEANPTWVAIRHYGWRNEFISIYPNAVSLKAVEGPDVRIIPWTTIIVLIILAVLVLSIRSRWKHFKSRRIDPVFDNDEDHMRAIDTYSSGLPARLRRWWRGKGA